MSGGPPTWTANWDTNGVSDGAHAVYVQSADPAGHLVSGSIVVTVDNTAPTCAINSPSVNQFVEDVWTFQIAATDSVGIDRVELTLFSTMMNASYNSQTGLYEYATDTMLVADGAYTISATAYDKSGKPTTATTVDFNVDNHAPTLTIDAPLNNAFVSGNVKINVTATDAFLNVTEYSVDDTGWVKVTQLWDTGKTSDGSHTLKVRALDDALHVTEHTVTVIVDNHAPEGGVSAPLSGQKVKGTYTFRVTATDEVGIESVTLTVFDSTIPMAYNPASGYYEYTIDTATVKDGGYSVSVSIRDLSGKSVTSGSVSFAVANTDTWADFMSILPLIAFIFFALIVILLFMLFLKDRKRKETHGRIAEFRREETHMGAVQSPRSMRTDYAESPPLSERGEAKPKELAKAESEIPPPPSEPEETQPRQTEKRESSMQFTSGPAGSTSREAEKDIDRPVRKKSQKMNKSGNGLSP